MFMWSKNWIVYILVEEIGLYYGFVSCILCLGDDGFRDVIRDRILIEVVKDC